MFPGRVTSPWRTLIEHSNMGTGITVPDGAHVNRPWDPGDRCGTAN